MGYNSTMGKWVHRLTDVNEENRTATCEACGPVRVRSAGRGGWRCAPAQQARKDPNRHKKIKRSYGLTADEAKQFCAGKVCAICGSAERLCVDHDHASGRIRDVLCNGCNSGLGMFREDPSRLRAAIEYVAKHAQEGS